MTLTREETNGAPRGGRDLTTGSMPRHLLAFSTPMLAGGLLQTAYSLINAFWVGKFLGTIALAAVTVSMPAVFVLIGAAGGLTLAANILVAQYYGARQWARIRDVVQTATALIGGASLVLLLAGFILAEHLLQLMSTPRAVLPLAVGYLRIFLWTMPLMFGIFLIGSLLRGIGDSSTPVYFQAASVALNTILDPLLMFGWLGLPRLGVIGTAWASIIAQIAALTGLLIYVPRRRALVAPQWNRISLDPAIAWLLVRIGLPAMVQQSVVSVSLLVIVTLVNRFGKDTVAAFGAAVRIDQVAFLPALTIGAAVATLAGQNIGARRFARAQQAFRWALLLSGAISGVITFTVVSIPGVVLRAFLSESQVIAVGIGYLRIVGITYVLYAVLFASNGVINGAGHTAWTTLFTIIGLWGIRLPAAWLLARGLHSERGIWYAMLVSVAASMVLSLAYYFSGRWKRPVVRSGVNNA